MFKPQLSHKTKLLEYRGRSGPPRRIRHNQSNKLNRKHKNIRHKTKLLEYRRRSGPPRRIRHNQSNKLNRKHKNTSQNEASRISRSKRAAKKNTSQSIK